MAKSLADVGRRFAGDDGAADPSIRSALAAAAEAALGDAVAYLRAAAALCGARLLVPLLAEEGADAGEHRAELAAVSLRGTDGRLGLLAFTGLDSLLSWNPAARPTPATLDEVAATVVEAGADVVVIDVAGPAPFEVGSDLVARLGNGERLVELAHGDFGWLQPPRR